MKGITDFIHIRDGLPKETICIWTGWLFTQPRFETITDALTEIDYRVKNLYEKRFIGRKDTQNKIIVHSSDTVVTNDTPWPQDAHTVSYSQTYTKTDEMSASLTAEISSEIDIRVPFVADTKFSFKLSSTVSQSQSISKAFTVTAPSQTISLPPHSKAKVTYFFYRYYDINNYSLDFEVDDTAVIKYPDFDRDVYYGDPTCCSYCLLYKETNFIFVRLNEFLRNNPDVLNFPKNASALYLEKKNEKNIFRNLVSTTETIMNYGVDVFFEIPENYEFE